MLSSWTPLRDSRFSQQEIEARNMDLRSQLVAVQRNLRIVIAEQTPVRII
jgi:hypothetical protein